MSSRNNTKNNFGPWGWSMIIYCAIVYYICSALATDGLNLYPEAFAGLRGWNANEISSWATIGGWSAIIGTIIFSRLSIKIGARLLSAIGLLATGVVTLVFAFSPSWWMFVASSVALQFIVGGILLTVVPNVLMNNWFPVKKGLALGWATMGMPLCTATFVALMAVLMNTAGSIANAYGIVGAVVIVFGLITLFWVKDNPEDVGCTPDNMPIDEHGEKVAPADISPDMTLKDVIRDKRAWFTGIGLGLIWMVTVGIVSRLIPRLMSIGYEQPKALAYMTLAAVCGIAGSYMWGFLDQKLGTRKTGMVYGAFYIIALICLLPENNHVITLIAVVLVGIGIGGIGNLVPSMVGTLYGRKNFLVANQLIMPVCTVIRSCAFAFVSIIVEKTGGFGGAYVAFIGVCVVGIVIVGLIGKSGDKPVEDENHL